MNIRLITSVAALALSSTTTVMAQDSGLMLDVKLERQSRSQGEVTKKDGVTFSVFLDFDKNTAVALSDDWKLNVLAKDNGESADLSLGLFAKEGDEVKQVGSPSLRAPMNTESSYRWKSESGEQYQVTLKPHRAAKPAKS